MTGTYKQGKKGHLESSTPETIVHRLHYCISPVAMRLNVAIMPFLVEKLQGIRLNLPSITQDTHYQLQYPMIYDHLVPTAEEISLPSETFT